METPDTKYAIMIHGQWGSGKTHLWRNNIHSELGPSQSLYVSLFGLKNAEEIDNEIFKALSAVGSDDGGIVKGLLNSSTTTIDDVRVGGLGYVVQFGLKYFKEKKIEKGKRLLICFDDVERWAGELSICLSYINKLVDHDSTKCLLLCNKDQLRSDSKHQFETLTEKTIGFTYTLEHSPNTILEAAIELASLRENIGGYVIELLQENIERIFDLLNSAQCLNIRILGKSVQYFSIIAEKNFNVFESSKANAVRYFVSLLATLLLKELSELTSEEKQKIFEGGWEQFLWDKIHKHGREDPDTESREAASAKRISEFLVSTAFGQNNPIKTLGIRSIVSNGFYKQRDFEREFSGWEKAKDFQFYLDTFRFWCLSDDEANDLFEKTWREVFDKKTVTDPGVLLDLADRLTSDVKRGVVDRDFDEVKNLLRVLIDDLYKNRTMRVVSHLDIWHGFNKYEYCKDIVDYVQERNVRYIADVETGLLSEFWVNLSHNPESLDELMREYRRFEIFGLYEDPKEILSAIELLSNAQLFELTRWMGSRLTENREAVDKEYDKAQAVADALFEQYESNFSVKAGHMKQIARILRNKQTGYDPENSDS